MARKSTKPKKSGVITIDLGRPNSEPQNQFFASRVKYTCYGGARGGGKSWCTQRKPVGGAIEYAGIRILILRRRYEDLENSVIAPIVKLVPQALANYNVQKHLMTFANGSTIKFGNMDGYGSAVTGKYQGQEYDWIFIEEATQFTEQEFRGIAGCCRGATPFPKRIYLTCNPGGIGHQWVKRIFITRDFLPNENPDDYLFIKATVEDNKDLLEGSPDYINALDLLPEDIRKAHRYGDWDALSGGYFPEFTVKTHVIKPFAIPDSWVKYRAFDYGLDMFACLWIAVDFNGRHYVYREFAESKLIVSESARAALTSTPANERVEYTVAPPDMWSTQKDTGKTMATLFAESGLPVLKANNSRVQGWLAVKEFFKIMPDGKPNMVVFETCKGLIDDIMAIQHDEKNPSDCAKQPHEITHRPDALRYYCQLRTLKPEKKEEPEIEEADLEQYDDYMTGGEMDRSYLDFSA
uniref:Large subunit terminase n=1 Tax=Myoviridae sp. ctxZR60 TaxID=2826712 RepID=A0A8S5MUX9_9CAUD|nr:MAG TPA: Large subunit terminase [Myoviridae sp. ctxZR60]